MPRKFFIALLAFVLAVPVFAAEPAALPGNYDSMTNAQVRQIGDQVSIQCQRFELRFAADGRPVSMKLRAEDRQLLNTGDPGEGFVVTNRAGQRLPLSRLSLAADGRTLLARTKDDGPTVEFRLIIGRDHIAFVITRLDRFGFEATGDLGLAFSMNCDTSVRAVPHNWMTLAKQHGQKLEISWPSLWTVSKGEVPGGFSIYQRQSDDDEDDILLHIWAEDGITHPKIEGTWNYETARAWIDRWMNKFGKPTGTVILEGKSLDDLNRGLQFAKAAGESEVYLMPWIWRGEYWPIKQTTAAINTQIFPRGEADLLAYAEKIESMGMTLALHWVSAGIGFEDPKYIGTKPDRRLASWGAGTLSQPVDAKAKTLKFKPAPGVAAPFNVPWVFDGSISVGNSPALPHFQNYCIVRVDDELVRFEKLTNTDQSEWTLTGCQRGYGSTKAADHAAGADAAGLIVSYGQNLIPDNSSTLLGEVATAYAQFVNRCKVSRVEFDGLEIHAHAGVQPNKMAQLLYAELDHPTKCNTSNGSPAPAWFEYRLNRVRNLYRTDPYAVVARLRSPSQNASSMLMAHYACTSMAANGTVAVGLLSGDRGFHIQDFLAHGQHEQFLTTMNLWRDISRATQLSQRSKFDIGRPRDSNARLKQAGNHRESAYVFVPEDQGDHWAIYPTRLLDTGNQNSLWYSGQENGPVEPWRFVKANEEHRWRNHLNAQPVRFVLHVLPATDPTDSQNISLQPTARQMQQVGDVMFTDLENGALKLACANPRATDVWNESDQPVISGKQAALDLSRHRAIGMWVEGDNSNAVLVFQVVGARSRDYAIPLDFTGRRWIEIPHGEASYALSKWGWRFSASKSCNYNRVSPMKLGLGYLPPKSNVNVTISDFKALREIPVELRDPSIVTSTGTLKISGVVPSDHYLEYNQGATATLYDANWNRKGELPVSAAGATFPAGESNITIRTEQPGPLPWLEVQLLARGEPIVVAKTPGK